MDGVGEGFMDNVFNMGEQYFKGVMAGYLGANFMCGPGEEKEVPD